MVTRAETDLEGTVCCTLQVACPFLQAGLFSSKETETRGYPVHCVVTFLQDLAL